MKTALILVGGHASRAGGYPKHQFICGDKTFLEKQIEELSACMDELFIVCRNEDQKKDIPEFQNISYIHDIREGQGPSGGIHSGAWHAGGEYFFVTACDMPYISCTVIVYLFQAAKGYDAAVPVWDDGKYEPLCAVYRRDAVRNFYETSDDRRLSSLIQGLHTNFVSTHDIRLIDPDLNVFCNVNDFESLSKINI